MPFSGWISQVSPNKEPRNAVTVMLIVSALLLCTILPSQVAFTSLVSAAAVPTITAYALICCKSTYVLRVIPLTFLVGRFFLTPHDFKHARWSLGRWSRPLTFIAMIWNTYLAAILFSPIEFPVTAQTFNCKYI